MSGADFISCMLALSFRKLVRNKYSLLAEILGSGIIFFAFFAFYLFNIFDKLSLVYLLITFLVIIAMGAGTKLGVAFINHRNQGFMQELYSSPLPQNTKIFGLMAESFALVLVRATILLVIALIFGIGLSAMEIFAVYLVVMISAAFSGFIGIIISSKTNNLELLTIVMQLLGFVQFGLNGMIVKTKDIFITALNPYSYIADIFLHASAAVPNYPLLVDLAVIALCLAAGYAVAKATIEKIEV